MALGTGYAPFRGGPLQYELSAAASPRTTVAAPKHPNPSSHESLTHPSTGA